MHPIFHLDCFKEMNKKSIICSVYDRVDYGHGIAGFWNYIQVSHSYFGLRHKQ